MIQVLAEEEPAKTRFLEILPSSFWAAFISLVRFSDPLALAFVSRYRALLCVSLYQAQVLSAIQSNSWDNLLRSEVNLLKLGLLKTKTILKNIIAKLSLQLPLAE